MKNIAFGRIADKSIKNPYHPSVEGVGYHGVGIHETFENGVITPSYRRWLNILTRCYNKEYQEAHKSYKGVTVCEEWKCFQNFAPWFKENYNPNTMKGWDLDKDIFSSHVKIYSPETCCFVPKSLNHLFKKPTIKGNRSSVGVQKVGEGRYEARIHKDKKSSYISTYPTEKEASIGYNIAREKEIHKLIEEHKHILDKKVYDFLINYKSKQ